MVAQSMRAARIHRLGTPEEIVVDDVPVPQPGPSQVLVKVEVAGVNWSDAGRRKGEPYPLPMVLPAIIGGEFYGTIERVGADVAGFAAGDRVFALHNGGAYAEYAIAESYALLPAPEGLDPAVGLAMMVQGMTAIAIFDDAVKLVAGQSVFVQGASGGVGLIALQLAKIYGAGTVIAAASSAEKAEICREYGADAVVNTAEEGWTQALRTATGGRGVDLVLEMTGGSVMQQSAEALADFGTLISFGVASNSPPILDFATLIPKNVTIRGFYISAYLPRPGYAAHALAKLADLHASGRLKVHMGGRFKLDQVREMNVRMEARQTAGKLVVTPNA